MPYPELSQRLKEALVRFTVEDFQYFDVWTVTNCVMSGQDIGSMLDELLDYSIEMDRLAALKRGTQ